MLVNKMFSQIKIFIGHTVKKYKKMCNIALRESVKADFLCFQIRQALACRLPARSVFQCILYYNLSACLVLYDYTSHLKLFSKFIYQYLLLDLFCNNIYLIRQQVIIFIILYSNIRNMSSKN